MNTKVQRALEKVGYQHNEIAVYLVMLQMGEGTVSEIARKANIPRSTTKIVISQLQKKGLVSIVAKRDHQVWVAENPNRILFELRDSEHMIERLLPELTSLRNGIKKKPTIRQLSGSVNIRLIFDDLMLSNYPIHIAGSASHIARYLGDTAAEILFEHLFSRNAPTRLLTTDSAFVQSLKENGVNARSRIHIYDGDDEYPIVYISCNSQLIVMIFSDHESMAVVIDDETLAESDNAFFQILWDEAHG